ncbi:uncharacterized protein LOC142616097 [Castanea sativa]|uniref:uncharacterized protein LOC142616097 n=1 Tax=Castanea sativa TaxID=21020 RepID=UPI003F64E457
MIALGWNCRGLGNLRSVRALREIVQRWDPNIVFLSEMKLNKKGMEKIKGKVGFSNGLIIPKSDKSGGLAMLWKKDIKLDYIDAMVMESQSGFKWRITGFYGHPETHRRKESWEQLRVLHRKSQLPWICFGDFNEISSAREELGGARRPQKQIDNFVAVIDECGFRDLGFSAQIIHGAI